MRVAICIGTFRRPRLLAELLESLSRLGFRKVQRPQIEIIVVDNDPSQSAKEICQRASAQVSIRYLVESRRGISHVRNTALRAGLSAEYIAFIDDDETASELWLDELLWACTEYRADVVAGLVRPRFAVNAPKWAVNSRCFHRNEYLTGTQIDKCATANVLISTAVFARIPGFDESFQLTGGEDTHFFLRVNRAGFRIVWSQEGVVDESISNDRANLRWILHRGYQSGNSWVLCESLLDQRHAVRFTRFCKATARLLSGFAASLISVPFSRASAAKHLRDAFIGVGMLAGLAGERYQAYQSPTEAPLNSGAQMNERTSR
jgi:succinoglycan biosynthesis protein ExoM